jgi:TonB family protein
MLLALLVLGAATAWAEHESPRAAAGSAQSTAPPSGVQPQAIPAHDAVPVRDPTPDKDGVYSLGSGITSPELLQPVEANYSPKDLEERDRPSIVIAYTVVNADGSAKVRMLLRPKGTPREDAAIAAINQSLFRPGTLNGHAVPVMVCVRVPFFHLPGPIPRMQSCPDLSSTQSSGPPDLYRAPPGAKMPVAIYTSEANFSEEARRNRIQGVVVLSTVVNEQGLPTEIRVDKSLGYGLDENAVRSLSRYKFNPATLDGHPIPVRITVEVSFKLR